MYLFQQRLNVLGMGDTKEYSIPTLSEEGWLEKGFYQGVTGRQAVAGIESDVNKEILESWQMFLFLPLIL